MIGGVTLSPHPPGGCCCPVLQDLPCGSGDGATCGVCPRRSTAAWPHARPYCWRSWRCCRSGSVHGSRTGPTRSLPAAPWHPHGEGPGGPWGWEPPRGGTHCGDGLIPWGPSGLGAVEGCGPPGADNASPHRCIAAFRSTGAMALWGLGFWGDCCFLGPRLFGAWGFGGALGSLGPGAFWGPWLFEAHGSLLPAFFWAAWGLWGTAAFWGPWSFSAWVFWGAPSSLGPVAFGAQSFTGPTAQWGCIPLRRPHSSAGVPPCHGSGEISAVGRSSDRSPGPGCAHRSTKGSPGPGGRLGRVSVVFLFAY